MTWCQRWRGGRHSFRPAGGPFDPRRYEVADVDELAAKSYVETNHYSRSYPASRLRYGLWDGTRLVGVAVLSVPVQASVLTNAFPGLVPYDESLELGRFVLDDDVPANGESWFLARVFKLAALAGVRGVVSFSDPEPRCDRAGRVIFPGHIGTIYQASNAIYTGRATPRTLRLLPDGQVLNDRSLQKIRQLERGHEYAEELLCRYGAPPRHGADPRAWLAIALRAAGIRTLRHPGNHRYLFTVGTRRRLVAVGVPGRAYPKSVQQEFNRMRTCPSAEASKVGMVLPKMGSPQAALS